MTDAELTLRPMTRAEFDEWLPRQVAGYAATDHGVRRACPRRPRGRRPSGTPRGTSATGRPRPGSSSSGSWPGEVGVGWLWLGVPGPDPDPLMAWVFEIEIEARVPRARLRARGDASWPRTEARARGMTSLGLNVHGQNTIARSLYESLGYEVTALQMKKPV